MCSACVSEELCEIDPTPTGKGCSGQGLCSLRHFQHWHACEFLNIPAEMRKHLSSGSHVTYPTAGLTSSTSTSLCCCLMARIIQPTDPANYPTLISPTLQKAIRLKISGLKQGGGTKCRIHNPLPHRCEGIKCRNVRLGLYPETTSCTARPEHLQLTLPDTETGTACVMVSCREGSVGKAVLHFCTHASIHGLSLAGSGLSGSADT